MQELQNTIRRILNEDFIVSCPHSLISHPSICGCMSYIEKDIVERFSNLVGRSDWYNVVNKSNLFCLVCPQCSVLSGEKTYKRQKVCMDCFVKASEIEISRHIIGAFLTKTPFVCSFLPAFLGFLDNKPCMTSGLGTISPHIKRGWIIPEYGFLSEDTPSEKFRVANFLKYRNGFEDPKKIDKLIQDTIYRSLSCHFSNSTCSHGEKFLSCYQPMGSVVLNKTVDHRLAIFAYIVKRVRGKLAYLAEIEKNGGLAKDKSFNIKKFSEKICYKCDAYKTPCPSIKILNCYNKFLSCYTGFGSLISYLTEEACFSYKLLSVSKNSAPLLSCQNGINLTKQYVETIKPELPKPKTAVMYCGDMGG